MDKHSARHVLEAEYLGGVLSDLVHDVSELTGASDDQGPCFQHPEKGFQFRDQTHFLLAKE